MSNAFDTANAPTQAPAQIIAGDYVAWQRTDLTDYSNTLYGLSYECRSDGEPARKLSINAAANNNDYLIELASTVTANYTPAAYFYDVFITRIADGARITIGSGSFNVVANKATSADDPRTFAKQMIDQIRVAIKHRADNQQLDTLAYSLGAETSATRDPKQLVWWLDYWKKELVKENRKARARKGQKHSGIIGVKF